MKSYQSANERGELLLDHVIITIKDLDRSIAFYETTLKSLGSELGKAPSAPPSWLRLRRCFR